MLSHTLSTRRQRARGTLSLVIALTLGVTGLIMPAGAAQANEENAPEVGMTATDTGDQTETGDQTGSGDQTETPEPPLLPETGAGEDGTSSDSDLPGDEGEKGDEGSRGEDAAPGGASRMSPPSAAPSLTTFGEPLPPITGEQTFIRVASSLRQGLTIGIRPSSASVNRIYQNGEQVDFIAAGSGSNFSYTEQSVDHPGLYLHKPSDNDGTVGTYSHYLECASPDRFIEGFDPACTMPEPFTVTIAWTLTGKLLSCVQENPWPDCADRTVHLSEIYQFYPRPPRDDEHDPVALFTAIQSTSDPYEFSFDNRSSDQDSEFSTLQFSWDFGDGETSTEAHPTHRYAHGGTYTVVLVVADPTSRAARYELNVEVASELIVNSTGDAPATDPGALGCDTGGTIGDDAVPECTLRAAIETANERGSGEITFAIDGEPFIALGAPLPTLSGTTSIDGTTQPGGWVEVVGGGEATLTLGGGTVTVTGLAVHGADHGVAVTAGTGHVIEGNRVGVSRTEAPTGDTQIGVALLSSADIAAVRGNVIAASSIGIANVSEGVIEEIIGNSIGVTAAGGVLSDVDFGVLLLSSGPSQIEDNLIRAPMFGIMVIGVQASGTSISANRVGTTGATAFAGVGTGIVVEAAADVVVDGNTVAAGDWGGIVIAGSVQVTIEDGEIEFLPPFGHVLETAVSATRVAITDNTVTSVARSFGIGSWADASELTISGNIIAEYGEGGGISLSGGSNHLVTDNVVGSAGSHLPGSGVWLTDTTTSTVSANTIFTDRYGIRINGDGTGAAITHNDLTGNGSGTFAGVYVENEREGVTVTNNTVADAGGSGIEVNVAPNAQIIGNTVTGSGHGITAWGEKLVIRDNRVGVATGSAAVIGNRGNGISILTGNGTLRGNTIAGSGSSGIFIAPGATATLRANRIWESGGNAITATQAAPQLTATLISDSESTRRTTLLITGIPSGEGGTIEVFANDSCGVSDAQAKYVMEITRDVKANHGMKIIQFESGRDHFTITYTSNDGVTSRLSNCESRTVYPDSDGDGSPDVIDELHGSAQDSGTAVLVTTNEQLLVVSTSAGELRNLRVMEDPADSHPAGWVLPYGVLGFDIVGLEPGGSVQMTLSALYSDGPIQGDSYWKYGPPTAGASPSWYAFNADPVTGTGAIMTTVTMGDLGFRRAFELTLVDGARGDSDGVANGTIVDPGGPVISATSGGGSGPRATSDIGSASGDDGVTKLAVTGVDAEGVYFGVLIGIISLLAGAVLLQLRRVPRSPRRLD